MLLARLIICVLLFCLPFVFFIAASSKPENAFLLIIPVFGAIPAVFGALIVFVPLELYLDARGLEGLKNMAVPAAGALLIVAFTLVMSLFFGKPGLMLSRLASANANELGAYLVWGLFGVLWGGLWRLTAWLAVLTGLSRAV